MARKRTARYRTGNSEIDELVDQLAAQVSSGANDDVVTEMLAACCNLALDRTDRGDLKLASASLRQLRTAFLAFSPYRDVRKVTVFGSARITPSDPLYDFTARLAREFADVGWMVVTGAGPGTMAACLEGAGTEASFGVAIELPWETDPNPLFAGDPKLVLARHFFIRKIGLVKESHAFVCMPGGFGTLDEMFEVLTLMTRGKGQLAPIYLLDRPDSNFWGPLVDYFRDELSSRHYVGDDEIDVLQHTTDIQEVVTGTRHFYSNFDSMRYVGTDLLLRLRHRPTDDLCAQIIGTFGDILVEPTLAVVDPPSDLLTRDLYGLRLRFDRHAFGRLYELIGFLNDAVPAP